MYQSKLTTRIPHIQDAQAIYRLIQSSPPLDLNSEYCYLLLCTHFAHTSVIAELDGKLAGFISAYLLPSDTSVLFIWQVVVNQQFRGHGISQFMFENILLRENIRPVTSIQTTVSPSNSSSYRMFEKLAAHLNAPLTKEPFITQKLFQNSHEEEPLLKIEPIKLTHYKGITS